jgi:hypothetical protein
MSDWVNDIPQGDDVIPMWDISFGVFLFVRHDFSPRVDSIIPIESTSTASPIPLLEIFEENLEGRRHLYTEKSFQSINRIEDRQ